MARAYTRSFGLATFNAAGGAVFYTAPAGYQSILRHVSISNFDAAEQVFSVRLAGQAVYLVREHVAPDTVLQVELRQVVPVNDSLIVDGSATSWGMALTGYVLLDDVNLPTQLPAPIRP